VAKATMGPGLRRDDRVGGALKPRSGPSANCVRPDLRHPVTNVLNRTTSEIGCAPSPTPSYPNGIPIFHVPNLFITHDGWFTYTS
jgi:hypothetical protein